MIGTGTMEATHFGPQSGHTRAQERITKEMMIAFFNSNIGDVIDSRRCVEIAKKNSNHIVRITFDDCMR